jgi:hypothetical protein
MRRAGSCRTSPLPDLVAVVAMDLVKNQHVERLHPKYWLRAARSLRYLADVLFELESPFAETFTLSRAPFIDVTPTEQKSGEVGKADRPVALALAACRT